MIGSSRVVETETETEVEAKRRSWASGKIRREEEGDGRSGEGKDSGKLRRIDDIAGKEEAKMSDMEVEERVRRMEEEIKMCDEEDEMSEMEEEEEMIKMVEHYFEEEFDEAKMLDYRQFWEDSWIGLFGSFEDITSVPAMRYTSGGRIPPCVYFGILDDTLQIFSVKVAEINKEEGLEWPLHVYGFVATRDNLDHNRDYLFLRDRDNCQILTQKDSFLQLTGPSRAVVFVDPVDFEVQLHVKGRAECDDKKLSIRFFRYIQATTTVVCRRYTSKLSTLEFTFALLCNTVEATICSVKVVKGSWPDHFRRRIVSRTASIAIEEILLLDSHHAGTMPVYSDDGGEIKLSRRVVSVELSGQLIVSVVASRVGNNTTDDDVLKDEVSFKPKVAGKSSGMCKLGFCEVEIVVAWSLLNC